MSTYEEAAGVMGGGSDASAGLSTRWQRLGDRLERWGEWLNPLLVKECRQALKSRQFASTFALLLLLSWLWTLFGITFLGRGVEYRFDGPDMFYGYQVILAFCLLVVVPYSAYRSLIAEREDNTYELIAITMLKPRQIVGGKLGSAIVQIVVYLSAVAPCLAFTYLLRGIDMPTIIMVLLYTVLGSIGLSLGALYVATTTKEKHWQIVVSVALILGLFYCYGLAVAGAYELLRESDLALQSPEFWIGNFAMFTAYASTFALLYLAAGAQLTFTADNRSTPLRIAMLAQHVLFAGWMGYLAYREAIDWQRDSMEPLFIYFAAVVIYWFVMGVAMCAENPDLSARVRRGLPKSFLGRVFLTWFAPGPGTGYIFVLANIVAGGLMAVGGAMVLELAQPGSTYGPVQFNELLSFCLAAVCYVAIYLGIGNLLLHFARRFAPVTQAMSSLVAIGLLTAGIGIPALVKFWSGMYQSTYNLIEITNPFSTLGTLVDGGTAYEPTILVMLLLGGGVVLFLNLLYVVPTVQAVRIAKPKRVEEEDAQAAAALKPATVTPQSPWDD